MNIQHGDAYDLVSKLAPASVDLILTSPPYWGLRTYGLKHNQDIAREWADPAIPSYDWYRQHGGLLGMEPTPEWFVAHLAEIMTAAVPAMKPSGSMWINLGDTYFARWASIRDQGRRGLDGSGGQARKRRTAQAGGYRQDKQLLMVPARFAIAMQESGLILRNDLIWFKPSPGPGPERDRLRQSHEHFFHFVLRQRSGRAKYFYDRSKAEPRCLDVVSCSTRKGERGHTATFPEDLIRPRIESSCPPGGLVVDPFCGTGRALAVAEAVGRRALGFDLVKWD